MFSFEDGLVIASYLHKMREDIKGPSVFSVGLLSQFKSRLSGNKNAFIISKKTESDAQRAALATPLQLLSMCFL